ncbi:hypothetical protein F0562_023814 [Nyssa sinensis]|uniref:NAC domain-containing protein n=1 Tax=Nyssa sinensis TaxID=561372 RepID=A0A5J5BLJ7_9ASTE|nr:hypothetical protein F0562_023814 [Nyssa sinensis]
MSGFSPFDIDEDPSRKRKAMAFGFGPGIRFYPTDQELIQDYLLYKVIGIPLVLEDLVKESDLYGDKEPWEIFDTAAERIQYFFTELKKKSVVGSRFSRTVGKGTWKGLDGRKQILDHQGRLIGSKRSFTYVNVNKSRAAAAGHSHYRWIMKEYSLDGINLGLSKAKDYVLCRIKYKNQGQKRPLIITTTHQSSSTTTDREGVPLPLAITATTTSHPPPLQYDYLNSRQDDDQLLEASSIGSIGGQHVAQQRRNLNEQLCIGDGDGDLHFPQEPTNINIEPFDLSCDYTIDDLLNSFSEEEFADDVPWNSWQASAQKWNQGGTTVPPSIASGMAR